MKDISKEEMYQKIIDYVENNEGFIKHNNIHLEELKDNYAKLSVTLTAKSLNPSGIAHGGLIFGLADSAMGMAARTNGRNIVTINSNIEYLRAGKGTKLTAIATQEKVGNNIAFYKTEIYADDNLCAIANGTFYFIDKDKLNN